MELILVRHGQPAWVVDGRNRNDPELTERGHAQAARVAARLADPELDPGDGPIDHLVVSPARRAQETCAPIATALGMEPATHDWLVEMKMPPDWEDMPIEVIEAAFLDQRSRSRVDWWEGLPGAETMGDFHDRVSGGLDGLLATYGITPAGDHALWDVPDDAPQRVVAVAHGGTNSTVIAHLIGAQKEPWDWYRFVMGHASVAVLRSQPLGGAHIWSLCALGDATHLDRADRTA